jgi:predicted nucleic acid-binding protein
MQPSFVIDACVVISALLEDEQNAYGMNVIETMHTHKVLAPSYLLIEVANVLLYAAKQGRITNTVAATHMKYVAELPIDMEPLPPAPAYALGIYGLADALHITAYDAMYLELALRFEVPLATLDKHLIKAAKQCGVKVLAA